MATFHVTNHLYPENPQLFVVDLQQVVKSVGEPNTAFHRDRRAERYWECIIYTSGVDSSGEALGPYWLDVFGSEQTVNEFIQNKVDEICQLIDWSKSSIITEAFQQKADSYSPIVYWTYPSDGQVDVPIDSNIIVKLRDPLPAKGIDISTLTFSVDGFSVTPEVSGNKYEYVLVYKPQVGR